MIQDYMKFMNEALATEMKVGDYVVFGKNYKEHKVKDQYGKIIEIRPAIDDPEITMYCMEIDYKGEKTIIKTSHPDSLRVVKAEDYEGIMEGKLAIPEFSNRFKRILEKMGYVVPPYKYLDMTCIDIDVKLDNLITFLPVAKSKEVSTEEKYKSRLRQQVKIGRFFSKMNDALTPAEAENLSNKYKAAWMSTNKAEDGLSVVKGEDIRYWYLNSHYNRSGGSLNSSCMQDSNDQHRFNIYCENPNKVALVIVVDDNEKLLARALLWRLTTPPSTVYLDRIYSVDRKYEQVILNRAKDRGWKTYSEGWGGGHNVMVELDKNYGSPTQNPYMDTMRTFGKSKTGYYLSNTTNFGGSMYTYNDH